MDQTLHAIVLRRRDAGESDRRLLLLTKERGLVDAVAKGARKGGSRLAGSSEPLAVSIVHLAAGKRQQFVTQTQPITSFPGLRDDYDRLTAALALAEVAAATTPHERPEDELFGFLLAALRYLEVHDSPPIALAWATVRLLDITGHRPSFEVCVETGSRIREAEPFFVASAGGYMVAERAQTQPGRVRTKAEVLVGLAKMIELDVPPVKFKEVAASLRLLLEIWREIASASLPTFAGFVESAT